MNWSALMYYWHRPWWIALSIISVLLVSFGIRELIRSNRWDEPVWEHLSLPFLDKWRKLPTAPRYLAGLCLFAGLYYLAFVSGRAFTTPLSAPLWFPDTVLLCALLLTDRKT